MKEFYNSLLCDKKPYFFKHLYKTEAKKYSQFKQSVDLKCYSIWDITLKQLLEKEDKTEEQEKFIHDFNTKNGFINSDCELNRICKYIESIHFDIKKKIREDDLFDYSFFITDDIDFNIDTYNTIYTKLNNLMASNKTLIIDKQEKQQNNYADNINRINFKKIEFITSLQAFKDEIFTNICSNKYEVVNYLIKIFYEDKKTLNKANLWRLCGLELYEIAYEKNNGIINVPKMNNNGDIIFWNNKFSPIIVDLKEEYELHDKNIR